MIASPKTSSTTYPRREAHADRLLRRFWRFVVDRPLV